MPFTLKIVPDQDPESPRNWDNLGTMVCFHKRMILGDKHSETVESLGEIIKRKDVISLPIYAYIHSGIALSTSRTGQFADPWDSGQLGYIYVTKEKIRENFCKKKLSKKIIERALECLEGEIETYNQFLSGDVYGYMVQDEKGETVESCWGFYGEEAAKEEGKSMMEFLQKEEKETLEQFETCIQS